MQKQDNKGRFTKKGNDTRQVRSIRLTNATWQILGEKADNNGMNRADFLEALTAGQINWNEESDTSLDFDIHKVAKILKEALILKSNAGGKIKVKVKEALEIMGVDLNKIDG